MNQSHQQNKNSQVSPEWIVQATQRYTADHAETHPEIAAFVEILGRIAFVRRMGGGVTIRSDGELIGFLWDEPQSIKVETDPHLQFLALVEGSQSHVELACLAPIRTDYDRDCPLRDGTGRLRELEEAGIDTKNMRCYCGGTGWLPRNVTDPPQG